MDNADKKVDEIIATLYGKKIPKQLDIDDLKKRLYYVVTHDDDIKLTQDTVVTDPLDEDDYYETEDDDSFEDVDVSFEDDEIYKNGRPYEQTLKSGTKEYKKMVELVEKYKTSENWKTFGNNMYPIEFRLGGMNMNKMLYNGWVKIPIYAGKSNIELITTLDVNIDTGEIDYPTCPEFEKEHICSEESYYSKEYMKTFHCRFTKTGEKVTYPDHDDYVRYCKDWYPELVKDEVHPDSWKGYFKKLFS